MKTGLIERTVEISAPLEAVYDAFARFEDLPEFVTGVQDVRLTDETHLRLRFGDGRPDAAAEITEQRPFERVAWHAPISGSVTFERLDPTCTRVTVSLHGDGNGGSLRDDLDRFKAVVESRGSGVR
jgi:uncharacterized membrane protein